MVERPPRIPFGRSAGADRWPGGKRFAFTIFDDADLQTVENGTPVYDFLYELGMRISKSVWVLPPDGDAQFDGASCADSDYLNWVKSLQRAGHEIALHNVASSTSARNRTHLGLDRFRELFGHDPRCLANHVGNLEAIYHGEDRVSGSRRTIYTVLTRRRRRDVFKGHDPESPLFWGDLCRERVSYVRNFVFRDINTLKVCPYIPYHDAAKPFVDSWFAASDGGTPDAFVATISERNQQRLENEQGLCIMYTHLGAGFSRLGRLDQRFEKLMRLMASRNGWFAPVSTILDHIRASQGDWAISDSERRSLERRWLLDKARSRKTT